MRCGYEREKVSVIPSTRESCGYGSKKISVIPSTRESCGYESKKVSVIPSTRESCGYGNKKVSVIPRTDVFEKGVKEMFQNYYVIQNRMKEIERIRESLQNEDRKYPEGELICAKNGKWYKW